ncbi:MAG TPA: alpha/beta hydrolase [Micropepsaceae bacterium]|nr:alpha/beta hydrolase [Micropepsaceae bacterium]
MRWRFLGGLFVVLAALVPAAAQQGGANDVPPIARQGYLFAGGHYDNIAGKRVMVGQLYAEFQIPKQQTHADPIVMVHGAIQTGTNFTGTPDGRMGWAEYFLRRGYAVYVIDQPGRSRASYSPADGAQSFPDLLNTEQRFTAPERYNLWPQAHLHTQWPGSGMAGDPVFDQFYASQVPFVQTAAKAQSMTRDGLIALLQKVGPAIVMTHSQSGSMGWLTADARPDLVRALIQVEPSGPPVHDVLMTGAPDYLHDGEAVRPWGLSAIPLNYSPHAASAAELSFVEEPQADGPGLARCWMQKAPARQLPNLSRMPMLIVNGEASFHAPFEHCTVKYLRQAGVHPDWIDLGKAGIHGNGHMMMLEKNNLEIAAAIDRWLTKALPTKSAARTP